MQEIAATALAKDNIPLVGGPKLPPELIEQLNQFTEKLEKVELKEVEVTGWKELAMEIPMDRELIERWGSPPKKKGDLECDDVLGSEVEPLSTPVRRVKVSVCYLYWLFLPFLLDMLYLYTKRSFVRMRVKE